MNISWLVTNALAALLLPPLNLLLLGLCGIILRRHWRRLGNALIWLAIVLLLLLSTWAGAHWLSAPIEQRSLPLAAVKGSGAQAIVILGGGRLYAAPEDEGRDLPGRQTLLRLRHGAHLQRQTGLPILVSGGTPEGAGESEAALMARSLREDFRVPVKWIESGSDNTAQNALLTKQQLQQAGITRVLLVTDALHMPRAQAIFVRAGLSVIAAPTAFIAQKPLSAEDFIPNAKALEASHYALHEWLGALWYQLRYDLLRKAS
jgi:uncharacterized SAM-binding protein YcdF (DUF218 family)